MCVSVSLQLYAVSIHAPSYHETEGVQKDVLYYITRAMYASRAISIHLLRLAFTFSMLAFKERTPNVAYRRFCSAKES